MTRPLVFVGYDPSDEKEKDQLLSQLKTVRDITVWSDDQIGPGADWAAEIQQAISRARIAVLLITAAFLGSDFILERMMPLILKRQTEEGLVVIPVIAKPCVWQTSDWITTLQVRPKSNRPVWSGGDSQVSEALAVIVAEVVTLATGKMIATSEQTARAQAEPVPAVNVASTTFSNISNSQISVGDIRTELHAEGDIVAGNKTINIHQYSPETKVQPKPHLSFEPELVEIPAGEFILGTDEGLPYEGPAHTVYLPTYHIGQYPVTNREFAAFIEATGKVVPALGWPGQRPAADQEQLPVRGITWYLALEYCAWLSQQTGRTYALPTEAEWEKAARGVDGRRYPWGNTWLEGRCNSDPARITPVEAYDPQSIYGCYDLVGNLREWTCSLWGAKPRRPDPEFYYPQVDKREQREWTYHNPRHNLQAGSQMRRIYRDGADTQTDQMYCSRRKANMPETKLDLDQHGFRVVLRVEPG